MFRLLLNEKLRYPLYGFLVASIAVLYWLGAQNLLWGPITIFEIPLYFVLASLTIVTVVLTDVVPKIISRFGFLSSSYETSSCLLAQAHPERIEYRYGYLKVAQEIPDECKTCPSFHKCIG